MKKSEIFRKNAEDLHIALINEINSKIEKIKQNEGSPIDLDDPIFFEAVSDQESEFIENVDIDTATTFFAGEETGSIRLEKLSDDILIQILEQLEVIEEDGSEASS